MSGKHNEHALGRVADLPCPFLSRRWWAHLLWRFLPSIWSTGHPQLLSDFDAVFLLLLGQQPGDDLSSNLANVQITWITWTVPYDIQSTAAMLWIDLQWSSWTSYRMVLTFLGFELVKGLPDISSSSSDVLEARVHPSCHKPAESNESNISVADLPEFTHNFTFAFSFLLSIMKLQTW